MAPLPPQEDCSRARNNSALAYGIPEDLSGAVRTLREGRKLKVDVGWAKVNVTTIKILEVFSVSLVSDLFKPADDLQHGNFRRIGEFT